MNQDIEICKKAFRDAKSHGYCNVVDFRQKLEDFDKTPTKLHEGEFLRGPMKSKCLIKKFEKDRRKAMTYNMMKNIRYSNIVSVRNFYDEVGQPRFVLSWADGTINAWVKREGSSMLFRKTLTGRLPTPTFRQIVVDLCAVLEHFFKEGIYPVGIGAQDLYMRKVGRKVSAQLLICEAESYTIETGESRNVKNNIWKEMGAAVKEIFKGCVKENSNNLTDLIMLRFFDHIGKGGGVKTLKNYPLDWSEDEKAKYLLKIMSMDISEVEEKLNKVKIGWPPNTKSGKLLPTLGEMKDYDDTRKNPANYDVEVPYDFMRICKKHD